MSEELQQRDLLEGGVKVGEYEYLNIGATSLNDLKKYQLIPFADYSIYGARKPDALLVDRRDKKNVRVIAVVEHKRASKFRTDKEQIAAIQQCNDVAQVLGASIGIITDSQDYIWINPQYGDAENNYVDSNGVSRSYSFVKDVQKQKLLHPFIISNRNDEPDILGLNDDTRDTYSLIQQLLGSISESNSTIKADKTNDPTELAKQIWQDVWSVSGATPENCLYTFVELFIFKYLSDLDILNKDISGNDVNFDSVYNLGERYAFSNYVKNVRPYLKQLFKPEKPLEEGGTTIINGTVLTGGVDGHDQVFFKILTRFYNFGPLKNIEPNFKSNLFEKFLKESISKKNWGQFFTPRKVIKSIIEMSGLENLHPGSKVCDPFCGVGGFVLEPLLTKERKNDVYVEGGVVKRKVEYFGYDKGFALDEQKTIILAKANMLIFLSDLIAKNKPLVGSFADVFNRTFHLRTKSILGTLDLMPADEDYTGPYDLILTNPPYVTSGSSNLKDALRARGLEEFYKISAMGVEGLAVEWIIKNLKVGGKAFIIVPDGILNRQNDNKLRRFILDECNIDCLISLPVNTFFTTPKKTYVLGLTKKDRKGDKQYLPVFTYLVSEIGETLDVYRFNIEQNDLEVAKNLFNMFKVNRTFVPDDKRCKIQPIERFIKELDSHWSVDRWWSKEEKIGLGIEEAVAELSKEEFFSLIKESSKEFMLMAKQDEDTLTGTVSGEELVYRKICLSDRRYFKLSIGKRILKKDLFNNRNNPNANIPVFSANVATAFGSLESSNIKEFNNPYILWGIDGDFEFSYKPSGEVFATTDHCGTIEILDKGINPQYLLHILGLVKHEYGFDRGLRSSLQNIQKIEVDFPVLHDDFDIEAQKNLVERYNQIGGIQKNIEDMAAAIASYKVKL